MSAEPPIEITHVPPRLRADFTGRLPEAVSGSPQEREANFLTRALAAFAIHKLSGCTLDEAASGVVDGGGDGGIDAVFYSPNTHRLWVIQSKYHQTGFGEPDLGSVTKFKVGLENLLTGNFAAFGTNAAWAQIVPKLEAIFRDGSLEVRAVLVYSGIHVVSEDRRRLFDDLKNRFSADDDYLQIQPCNLTTVHDWLTGADEAVGVAELEFTLFKPGWVTEPYETVYGLIPLAELASLYTAHGRKLITANIRAYRGDTTVNDQIMATVKQEAEHFFYLNNGLTAYCSRLEVNNLDRDNAQRKRIRAFGLSIVNGAQTLGSVAECFDPMPNPVPAGHAFLKVVSLERCADDREFAARITHSTNFQNQIGARDFVALDEQQERIANQLILSGIHYHYKDGVDTPTPDASNFTLEEATTACAALSSDCDFLVRILANRKSLWSLEEAYPKPDVYRSRYARVFRPERSARTVWRAVQTQRAVIAALRTSETGIRKDFFENGRWLVLNLILVSVKSERGVDLTLTPDEIITITRATQEVAEELWNVCANKGFVTARTGGGWDGQRHFRSVFSSAADCEVLRSATLSRIAAARSTAQATPSPIKPTGNGQ